MSDTIPRQEKRYIFKISPPSIFTRHTSQQEQQQQQQQQPQQQQQAPTEEEVGPSSKRQKFSSGSSTITLPLRPTVTRSPSRYSPTLTSCSVANDPNDSNIPNDMSDGSMSTRSTRTPASANPESGNEARAIRVMEIMNDFRTLQTHITSLVTRPDSNPPDQASYYLSGYSLLRECSAAAQAILATHYSPGNLGLGAGSARVPDTEVQRATLQRIILDASTRRFQAHLIYLKASACMRWVMLRQQINGGNHSPGSKRQALAQIDARLAQEIENITDDHVVNDLRAADRRKNYWLAEDPSLERMLAWIRRQS